MRAGTHAYCLQQHISTTSSQASCHVIVCLGLGDVSVNSICQTNPAFESTMCRKDKSDVPVIMIYLNHWLLPPSLIQAGCNGVSSWCPHSCSVLFLTASLAMLCLLPVGSVLHVHASLWIQIVWELKYACTLAKSIEETLLPYVCPIGWADQYPSQNLHHFCRLVPGVQNSALPFELPRASVGFNICLHTVKSFLCRRARWE